MRSVKSARRLLQKLYWSRWFDSLNGGARTSLSDFIRIHATEEFGVASVDEAAESFEKQEFQGCVPYRKDICGDYPELLEPCLRDPPFKLIFEGGKLVRRTIGPSFQPHAGGRHGE
jgi:hypothetical protein